MLLCAGAEGKTLHVYFPPAKWYDWYTYKMVTDKGGLNMTIDTPVNHLPVSRTTSMG